MNAIEHLQDHKWQHPEYYAGHSPIGSYLIYSKNRDSSLLEQSNFDCILAELEQYDDPENPAVYTFTASHWACGWIEYIIVNETDNEKLLTVAGEIVCALSDYPVFSEDHYSEVQHDAICDHWENASISERMDLCKDCEISIFSARSECIPSEAQQWLMDSIY